LLTLLNVIAGTRVSSVKDRVNGAATFPARSVATIETVCAPSSFLPAGTVS